MSQESEPEPKSSDSGIFKSFLRGIGSALEIFPPPERFNRWRISQDISIDEWPAAVRAALADLQMDAAEPEHSDSPNDE
jgi:hypothetical protein